MDQLHKDDQIKLLNNKNVRIAKTGNKRISRLALPCDTLDQGTEAFMQWLSSDDKMSTINPVILKQFVHSKYTVLYDNTLNHDVTVETDYGYHFARLVMLMIADMWDSPYSLNRSTKMTVLYSTKITSCNEYAVQSLNG